jgi:import receptor subunit TOM70
MENQLYEEAEVNFERTLALDPRNASVLVHKAMSRFQRSGDPNEAIKMLTEALKVDDRNEFIFETLGTLSLQM